MSLAGVTNALARRQNSVLDTLKSLTVRTFAGLASPLPSLATRSATAAAAPLPSLAALQPVAPTAASWGASTPLWGPGSALQQSLLTNLGGVRNASSSKLKPPFQGGKIKPYTSYRSRFKMTATGKIRYMRPGRTHKRHNKGRRQLADLGATQVMDEAWAKTMRRLGFVMRRF